MHDQHDSSGETGLGKRVRDFREQHGMTRRMFLLYMGPNSPSESTLRNIEGGYQTPGRVLESMLEQTIAIPPTPAAYPQQGNTPIAIGEEPRPYDSEFIGAVVDACEAPAVRVAAEALAAATGQTVSEALVVVVSQRLAKHQKRA